MASRTSSYYKNNPKAKAKRLKQQAEYNRTKEGLKIRTNANKLNRKLGTYGNGDGKDASHKGGKIVGFESASKNRGRKEKSRLKKK